jgi:AcrR family transcriptional regulator
MDTATRTTKTQAGGAQPAGRRRGALLEEAILDAAHSELAEHGYAGLTMEGVAARAQTSKPVVYRRWPSRARLAVAAIVRSVPDLDAAPDTGALRTDLIEELRLMAHRFDNLPQGALFGVLADSLTEPDVFRQVQEQVTGRLQEVMSLILRRAVERGEIRPERVTPRVVRAPQDLLRSELFLRGGAPPDEFIIETVDEVLLPLLHAL